MWYFTDSLNIKNNSLYESGLTRVEEQIALLKEQDEQLQIQLQEKEQVILTLTNSMQEVSLFTDQIDRLKVHNLYIYQNVNIKIDTY